MIRRYFFNLSNKDTIGNVLLLSIIFSILVLWIDYKNLPSEFLPFGEESFRIVFIIFLLLLIIGVIIKLKLIDALFLNFFTLMDNLLMTVIVSILLMSTSYILGFPEKIQHRLLLLPLLILSILILIFRIYKVEKGFKKSQERNFNIIDFKDIYQDTIQSTLTGRFYIDEESVDYDLLERDKIINHLYDALTHYTPKGKFVISLEGEWGAGKTTIINSLKRRINEECEDIIVIDKFDPWIFMDQESMLENMLNYLLTESGVGFNPTHVNQIITQLSASILGSSNEKWLKKMSKKKHINEIKQMINIHLQRSGKNIVFIIDNIDRAEPENALLIFKLVNHILDFKGITYLLSFDREQINQVLQSSKIPAGYMKKIIQLEVPVPTMDKQILKNIYLKSISTIVKYYKRTDFIVPNYEFLIESILNNKTDLRDFKRLLNSVFIPTLADISYLNLQDELSIEYIKFSNKELYDEIYNNRRFFIYYHAHLDSGIFIDSVSRENFNQDGKKFFDNLFLNSKHNVYLPILIKLFPYVRRYNSKQDLKANYTIPTDPSENYTLKNRGISSAKYFDLYFTSTQNMFANIALETETIIKNLSENTSIDDITSIIKVISDKSAFEQRELFEQLHLRIESIPKNNIKTIIIALFNNLNSLNNHHFFLSLGARGRAEIIIAELLTYLNRKDAKDLVQEWINKYDKLRSIYSIINWLENDEKSGELVSELKFLYQNIVETILKENINLYDDKHYYIKNIFGVYRSLAEQQSTDDFKNYIEKVLNKKTIYRVLLDIIQFSTGSVNKYEIQKSTFKLFTTEEKIDSLLQMSPPRTDSETFIVKVYEKYKDGDKNDTWGMNGVEVDKEIDLIV